MKEIAFIFETERTQSDEKSSINHSDETLKADSVDETTSWNTLQKKTRDQLCNFSMFWV